MMYLTTTTWMQKSKTNNLLQHLHCLVCCLGATSPPGGIATTLLQGADGANPRNSTSVAQFEKPTRAFAFLNKLLLRLGCCAADVGLKNHCRGCINASSSSGGGGRASPAVAVAVAARAAVAKDITHQQPRVTQPKM